MRSFDDGIGDWHLGIGGQERLRASPAGVVTNFVERGGAILATLINTRESAVKAEMSVAKDWLAYEPLAETLLAPADGFVRIDLDAGAYRHIMLVQRPKGPCVLTPWAWRPAVTSVQPGRTTDAGECRCCGRRGFASRSTARSRSRP